jgi:hypothetical protein
MVLLASCGFLALEITLVDQSMKPINFLIPAAVFAAGFSTPFSPSQTGSSVYSPR